MADGMRALLDASEFVSGSQRLPAGFREDGSRFQVLATVAKVGSAGLVRNEALAHASGEWVAFLDDDDQVRPQYVEHLRLLAPRGDVIVSRMEHPDLGIIPALHDPRLYFGNVGISYAVRRERLRGLRFVRENADRRLCEDWELIQELNVAGARFVVSKWVDYVVREGCPAVTR